MTALKKINMTISKNTYKLKKWVSGYDLIIFKYPALKKSTK